MLRFDDEMKRLTVLILACGTGNLAIISTLLSDFRIAKVSDFMKRQVI